MKSERIIRENELAYSVLDLYPVTIILGKNWTTFWTQARKEAGFFTSRLL